MRASACRECPKSASNEVVANHGNRGGGRGVALLLKSSSSNSARLSCSAAVAQLSVEEGKQRKFPPAVLINLKSRVFCLSM